MSKADRITAITVHAYRRMRASVEVSDPHEAFNPAMRDSMRELDSDLEDIIDDVLTYFEDLGLDKQTLLTNLEL